LAKLTGRPDPVNVIFGGLLEQYLAYGKKKTGKKKLTEVGILKLVTRVFI
jgi:hypothetical protein